MLRRWWKETVSNRSTLVRRGLVLLGLVGMGCILLSSLLPDSSDAAQAQPSSAASAEEYRTELQTQLAEMLGCIEGVGEVRVLVTLAGSEEYHYVKADDRTVSDTSTRSSESYVTVGGSREALLQTVAYPEVTGAVIACTGASSPRVQEQVTRAAAVALGIGSHQICVLELSQG